jgi:pimeloyl-ACP methyl ester carboxylesterase
MFAETMAACAATVALLFAMTLITGCASGPSGGPFTIESQGSFFVGGRQVTAAGTFDPTLAPNPPTAGQTYWVDHVLQHLVPTVSDNPQIISDALIALLNRIGPAVVVTHSQSGLFGWLAGARSPLVRGIVSYEPGFVFTPLDMPKPIPLFKGTQNAGTAVSEIEFAALAKLPIQVVYGDNIPTNPIADLVADGRRAQVITSKLFVDALNRKGGKASVLHLPDAGLRGNSHFMFSDLNNIGVADQLSVFLRLHGLDAR